MKTNLTYPIYPIILFAVLIFSNYISATTIAHNISTSNLIISGSSADDYIVTGSTTTHYIIAEFGYKGTITLSNCTIQMSGIGVNSPIRISGKNNLSNTDPGRTNVNLILEGNNVIQNDGGGRACIQVDQGAQINIGAIDPCDNSSGQLSATQVNADGGAGIGSLNRYNNSHETISMATISNGYTAMTAGGNIVISSGTISVKGGHGAGIGGGYGASSDGVYYDGMIVIYGGVVDATSHFDAAGIGSGCPRGTGLVTEYAPNSAVVVLPPAIVSAKGAGESPSGGVGTTLFPELGLAGTKVRVYIGDPNKPTIRIKTRDNTPNANIYFDLSQDPDINRVITTAVDASLLSIHNVLLGQTDESGIFSTTGSLTNPTTFFTDATNDTGSPYLPITKTLPNGGSIEFDMLQTKFSIYSTESKLLKNGYTSSNAQKSATSLKITYNDTEAMTNIVFDLASGSNTSFSNLIFLASDSLTVIPAPTNLYQGDEYYIIIPIKNDQEPKIYTDVLRLQGTWNGASTGYIRKVISQIVADIHVVNICEGDSYYFNGKNLTEEGIYTDVTTSATACATGPNLNEVIELNVFLPKKSIEEKTICDSELPLNWNDTIFDVGTQSGTYIGKYISSDGCDSIVTLHLIVGKQYNIETYDTICEGETYTWNGIRYNKSGSYTQNFLTKEECDSIITLNLTVGSEYYFVDSVTLCQGEEIMWQGRKVRNRGKFFAKYKTICGCDSIYELNVHVNPSYYEEITETICGDETYTFGGQILHQSGVYIDSAMSMYGCDSVTKLILTKYDSYLIDEYIETCYDDTFYFRGKWVEEQGIYYDSLLTRHGCDSVYRLIYNKTPGFVFYSEEYICKGETYNFRGRELTTSGLYCDTLQTESGCDSIFQVHLRYYPDYFIPNTVNIDSSMYEWRGEWYTEPGIYYDSLRTSNGCDSIYQLTLTFEHYTHIHHAKMLPICADDPVGALVVNYSGTTPKYCHLFYSPEALAEGFKNISNIPFTGDTIIVNMPNKSPYITPDKYNVTLHLDNGVTQSEYNVEFLLSYPSWIIQQNWQDVVAVLNAHNNGGYYFDNYEWFVNRQAITSHTSYLYSPQLKIGDEVLVYLTREGENYSIPTCPLIIEERPNINEHPTIVFPTKLAKGQKNITVKTGKQGCAYYLCDLLGRTIATGECYANELRNLELPLLSGTLLMHIIESETQFSHTTRIYIE